MNILKIVNGDIEIRDLNGGYVRAIQTQSGRDAVSAEFNSNQTLIAITTKSGNIEIRDSNGGYVREIQTQSGRGDATNARWVGEDIAITTKKGTTELRDKNGYYIRTL